MRIAAVGDIHYRKDSPGKHRERFLAAADLADVLLLCGDLTDFGLTEEAELLAADLHDLGKPVLAVLGNHDHEDDRPENVVKVLHRAGVKVLDGDCCRIDGVGFAGVKGFGGGFGRRAIEAWGEMALKQFIWHSEDEARKLDKALKKLADAPRRVVLLHYAPIPDTVQGEPPELYPMLGSTLLEEVLDAHHVTVALHGHVHHGSPTGCTKGGVPVFNVAYPVLRDSNPDGPGFRLLDLDGPLNV